MRSVTLVLTVTPTLKLVSGGCQSFEHLVSVMQGSKTGENPAGMPAKLPFCVCSTKPRRAQRHLLVKYKITITIIWFRPKSLLSNLIGSDILANMTQPSRTVERPLMVRFCGGGSKWKWLSSIKVVTK